MANSKNLTPYYNSNFFYACGYPITIDAAEETGKLLITWGDGEDESLVVPEKINIFGGCDGSKESVDVDSTSVIVNGGNIKNVWGGNYGAGTIGSSKIVVNNGTFPANINGSVSGGSNATPSYNKENTYLVKSATIVINGGYVHMVFGGGTGYATVNKAKITLNGGDLYYLVASGSNGTTGESEVTVNGGTVKELLGVNRGSIETASITVNDGEVEKIIAGTNDGPATYKKSVLNLYGGTVSSVEPGWNGDKTTDGDVSCVSGTFFPGVVQDEESLAVMNIIIDMTKGQGANMKRCKVLPRNGLQYISGILANQKRIELPAELPLSKAEVSRCMSFADVYEVLDGKDVLLTPLNFYKEDNSAEPAAEVPDVEFNYPRNEVAEEEEVVEDTVTEEQPQAEEAAAAE
jgi:hypothetical protein